MSSSQLPWEQKSWSGIWRIMLAQIGEGQSRFIPGMRTLQICQDSNPLPSDQGANTQPLCAQRCFNSVTDFTTLKLETLLQSMLLAPTCICRELKVFACVLRSLRLRRIHRLRRGCRFLRVLHYSQRTAERILFKFGNFIPWEGATCW